MITGGNLTVTLQKHEIDTYTSENVFASQDWWKCRIPGPACCHYGWTPTVYLSTIVAYRRRATRITMFLSVGSPREARASLDFSLDHSQCVPYYLFH